MQLGSKNNSLSNSIIIYVIVIDAFAHGRQKHMKIVFLSRICYCNWSLAKAKLQTNFLYVTFVDDGHLKRVVLTNACALTCWFLCLSTPPTHPTPFPFPSFATGKPPPTTHLNVTPNTLPRDTNMNLHPFAKTTSDENYPLVSARMLVKIRRGKAP